MPDTSSTTTCVTPYVWIGDNAEPLSHAYHVCADLEDNSVTIYGKPGALALIRMNLDAKSCDDGKRVRTWTAEVDGGMTVVLIEVGLTEARS